MTWTKYKIKSYKVGFFTVLQSNLQLHKNEEHLNQSSFHSRVKFKTFCKNWANKQKFPPPKNKKNKKKRNSLSCSTSFFNYAKRITVNSPTDQLADANSPTYKIE